MIGQVGTTKKKPGADWFARGAPGSLKKYNGNLKVSCDFNSNY